MWGDGGIAIGMSRMYKLGLLLLLLLLLWYTILWHKHPVGPNHLLTRGEDSTIGDVHRILLLLLAVVYLDRLYVGLLDILDVLVLD